MILRMCLRRLGVALVTLWVVTIIMFAGTELLPGDVAEIALGQEATPESVRALRARLGIDRPAVVRYADWVGGLLRFDLGKSLAGRSGPNGGNKIEDLVGPRMENTLVLAGLVAAIAVPLSILIGLFAAMFPGSWYDRSVTFTTLALVAVPEFFTATLLVLVFGVHLRWLPTVVVVPDFESVSHMARYLVLPVSTLCLVLFAQMARMTRATVLNVMSSPYIEMAILKGVPRSRVIWRHALFNAIGPISNIVALNLAYLITGVVIVETIFTYPGLGGLMVDAVRVRDMPLVQACGIYFCLVYLILILTSDIASIVSNPRLRHPK
ncbi:MAG: ABC transporter permease [Thiotrichales bacterium]|nr:ABC transporter permease [Thiotrichales bacterium]